MPHTHKSAARRLLGFSIPIFFANFLQIFYSLTDMAVVGRYTGETGLAAIANGTIAAYLIGSIGVGLAVGGSVVVGHYFGAKNREGTGQALASLLSLAALVALVIIPFGVYFADEIFALMNVAPGAREGAAAYFSIMCFGNPFFFCGTALSFSLRALGDSKSPLYFMLAGGLVNIGLDIVLVGPLGMGVAGAAWATLSAQAGSLAFAVVYLKRRDFVLDFTPRTFAPRLAEAKRILAIGLPTMIQVGLINTSYLVIGVLINGYGVTASAAAGVGIKISTLAVMPAWAIGQSLTALAANSLGANKPHEAEILTKAALRLNLIIMLVVALAVQIAARPLMQIFNPDDAGVIREGILYLRLCCSFGIVAYAAMYTFNSLAIGAGASLIAMWNAIVDAVIMRLAAIALFSQLGYDLVGIYLAQALSAFIPAAFGGIYFYRRRWRNRKVI